MDKDFLALSVAFMILGVVGIILFSSLFTQYQSIFPVMTPAGDSCYCMISSPEPEAAQGTSSILLALGVMFFPMGLMKGGLPSFRRMPGATAPLKLPSGRVVTPVAILSGRFFALGLVALLVGVDAVLVPGYLVFGNKYYELAGAVLAGLGALSMLWGLRKPKSE
ncbi:MAG TPA: hypothetical protein VGR56_02540 [Nitrososphaerales archaeon]|nr:hypothetical protein [Nitrososphaerales archaeon]